MVNNEILNPPKQSLTDAINFLHLLDEGEEDFTFQTFTDDVIQKIEIKAKQKDESKLATKEKRKVRKIPDPLAKTFNGNIESVFNRLVDLNNKGAGVFINVQRTDLKGRAGHNITGIRAVYQELDNEILKENPLEPHIVVQSSIGKVHNYFLCDNLKIDELKPVINRMVNDYGSDKNAVDLTRVLRLPGFFHAKHSDNRQLVQVIHESSGIPYSRDKILESFPPDVKKINGDNVALSVVELNIEQSEIKDLESALLYLSSDDRDLWVAVGHALRGLGMVGFGLWLNWSAKSANFDHGDALAKWETFNATQTHYKSVFKKAYAAGWEGNKKVISDSNNDTKKESTESFLDTVTHSHKIDFLESIDKRHILAQLSKNVAHVCYMPEHSVYMTALGVFSAMACRRYKVKYKHNGDLPISLYVMAEQPSGAAKSRSLTLFQHPFRKARKISDKARKERIAELKKDTSMDSDYKAELNDLQENAPPPLFITNATPEALEQTLTPTGGYFAAVSSEKGLANAILGASYGDSSRANNNDVLLNGFDGGYVASIRVTRSGYEGNVVGSVVVIAQQGSIERLLGESDGSGLSERFLLLSEEHYLGKRDFTEERFFYRELVDEYNAICEELYDLVNDEKTDYEDLIELDICKEGHDLIAEYRNNIEKDLADGGRLSSTSIRGAAAKVDMQIMKIAANLHLLGGGISSQYNTIDIHYVRDAITIANNMLDANLSLCTDKGITGLKSEYESILSLFEKTNMPRTERMILQCKRRTAPFKDMSFEVGMTKTKYIKNLLQSMLKDGTLICSIDGAGNTVFKSS